MLCGGVAACQGTVCVLFAVLSASHAEHNELCTVRCVECESH